MNQCSPLSDSSFILHPFLHGLPQPLGEFRRQLGTRQHPRQANGDLVRFHVGRTAGAGFQVLAYVLGTVGVQIAGEEVQEQLSTITAGHHA
jgi:hypothetical protein